jgi:hypothetical protein
MAEDSGDEINDKLESLIRRLSLIEQRRIEPGRVDVEVSKEELVEISEEIIEEDNIPKRGEERYSYLSSVLRLMIEESFEDGISAFSGLIELSIACLGDEILENEEFERFEGVVHMIGGFSEEELNKSMDYVKKYRETDESIAVSQNLVELSELVESGSKVEVDDSNSARKAIEIYSKCMDVCDNASTMLVGSI